MVERSRDWLPNPAAVFHLRAEYAALIALRYCTVSESEAVCCGIPLAFPVMVTA
jgi:hypothetical protein